MNNLIMDVKDIYKNYEDSLPVLKGVSFKIYQGDFTCIMGDSGCGKSSLLYILGGLESPTSGSVIFDDKDIFKLNDKEISDLRCNKIGFVFQFYNLVMNLTVEENILLPVVMAKRNIKEYQARLEELLDLLSLKDKRNVTPDKLSGGTQQRVAIARAIINNPMLLLADEPTGNLDSKTGQDVLKIFKDINEKYGISILMVTHSNKASKYAKKILHMSDGVFLEEQL